MHSLRVLVLLCLALLPAEARKDAGKVAACAGKKIFVIDIGVFAKEAGMPSCNLATVRGAPIPRTSRSSMQISD